MYLRTTIANSSVFVSVNIQIHTTDVDAINPPVTDKIDQNGTKRLKRKLVLIV